jgi:hypothetical protein
MAGRASDDILEAIYSYPYEGSGLGRSKPIRRVIVTEASTNAFFYAVDIYTVILTGMKSLSQPNALLGLERGYLGEY